MRTNAHLLTGTTWQLRSDTGHIRSEGVVEARFRTEERCEFPGPLHCLQFADATAAIRQWMGTNTEEGYHHAQSDQIDAQGN